jgi:hypothetical protein
MKKRTFNLHAHLEEQYRRAKDSRERLRVWQLKRMDRGVELLATGRCPVHASVEGPEQALGSWDLRK